jgi:hypothetical protein
MNGRGIDSHIHLLINIMRLNNYCHLIRFLPVKEQCFSTKRDTWENAENNNQEFKLINDRLFNDSEQIKISRQDIFNTDNIKDLIIKTIFWGYPSGMRGNNFINLINQLNNLEGILNQVKNIENPTFEDYKNLHKQFTTINGLGLSTYSKILYFLNLHFDGKKSLILDSRLIDVFSKSIFEEFKKIRDIKYNNANNFYQEYLIIMNNLSIEFEVSEENIELFLFMFGSNLKEL